MTLASLSPQQAHVFKRIAEGHNKKAIARELSVAHGTVSSHRMRILEKLGLSNDAQIAVLAFREGVTTWPLV